MSRIADEFLALHRELLDEDQFSPRVARAVAGVAWALQAWFRFRVEGWERVVDGPCLIVANHSAAAPLEVALLLRAWRGRFGQRSARGLAHRIAWQAPFRWFPLIQWMGGLYAHPRVAGAALSHGCALLVFPGGDVEATRPFGDRYRIAHDGREGFVRLARAAKVPIVPLVLCGSHAAYVVLPGARRFGRRLGVERRFGFKGYPLTLGSVAAAALLVATIAWPDLWPWLVATVVQAIVPLPSRIEATVGEPLVVRDDESDAQAAARVRAQMQAMMDCLAARRRTPWG